MKEKGETRILFLTDIHAPYHDAEALDIAMHFGREKGVDEVIVSELPDLYKVSSWLTDPSAEPFYEELAQVEEVTDKIAKFFKKQKVTYLVGNHEERITKYLWRRAPELYGVEQFSIPSLLGIRRVGWDYIDNKQQLMANAQPLRRGKLTILHGHEVRMGWGAVNIAKIMYERCRSNVIVGHFHRAQEWVVRLIDGSHEGCWTVGCLCDLHPEYMPHNDWVHGFAILHMYAPGTFSVENRKIIGGKVL
jgi:UDP-2,3-diacylglucosamine pyrophosphatase LpxH